MALKILLKQMNIGKGNWQLSENGDLFCQFVHNILKQPLATPHVFWYKIAPVNDRWNSGFFFFGNSVKKFCLDKVHICLNITEVGSLKLLITFLKILLHQILHHFLFKQQILDQVFHTKVCIQTLLDFLNRISFKS